MDIVTFKDIVIGAAAVLAAALTIWNFFQSPSKKNEAELTKQSDALALLRHDVNVETRVIDDKIDAIAGRVSTIETTIHQMPDKDSQHRLELALEKVSGRLDTMNERLNPIDNLARRLQENLLENSSRTPAPAPRPPVRGSNR